MLQQENDCIEMSTPSLVGDLADKLVRVDFDCFINLKQGQYISSPEFHVFLSDAQSGTNRLRSREAHIHYSFLKKNKPKIAGEKIYSQDKITLSKTEYCFQLICLNEKEKDILWSLNIDLGFSQFEYNLSSEADGTDYDLYKLIFNRFLLQHTFINHHGLIIHAAGGSVHGKGMVFPAVSGTGKSTLSHLLLPFPENQLYSEERIIMRKMDDGWQLWGTPWKGTGVIARNESAPLSALVFLSQAPQTKISELTPSAALRRLLETVSIPWYSQEWTDKGLAVCESLLRDIPAFELAFRPDQTAVQAVADLAASLP
jgi:hypothetical protein